MKVIDLIKELEKYDMECEVYCPTIIYWPDDQCSCTEEDVAITSVRKDWLDGIRIS